MSTPMTLFHLPQDDDTPDYYDRARAPVSRLFALSWKNAKNAAHKERTAFFRALVIGATGLLSKRVAGTSKKRSANAPKRGFPHAIAAKKFMSNILMHENGSEIWRWLQDGAHIYVCGDEAHMAKDVHAALISLIADEGGVDGEEYIAKLGAEGRYRRDVY